MNKLFYSIDLKKFANSLALSLKFEKDFLDHYNNFLTVGENNFGNKIPSIIFGRIRKKKVLNYKHLLVFLDPTQIWVLAHMANRISLFP